MSLAQRLGTGLRRRLALCYLLFFRRPLRPREVILGCAVLSVATYFTLAWLFRSTRHQPEANLISLLLLLPAVWGVLELAMRRKHVQLVAATALCLVIGGPLVVKYERCPHATYLHLLPVKTIVLTGEACGNYRDYPPWWSAPD